jgi:hypothetical protein
MKPRRRIFQPGCIGDIELVTLALTCAYSGKYLAARTKMSRSMAYYRLHAVGIKLNDLRNGGSPIHREVELKVAALARAHVEQNLLPRFAP